MEHRGAGTRPDLLVVAGSLALAAASLLLVRALSYDAWGWLIWGRELVGRLPLDTNGYPTWKPLTGLVAVPLAPLGTAAPLLWLTIARFGAVLSVVLAFHLGRRVAGVWAGALAAASLVLMPEWLFQSGVGGSEPLLTALLLAAVDRHADRHDGTGIALVLGASLLRPESWPLLLASGAVAWRRRPPLRPLVVAGVAVVPALWFGGDYVGSGNPFTGGRLAQMSREAQLLRRGALPPSLDVLQRASQTVLLPLLACVPVGLARGGRSRDPILLPLALGGLVWLGEVAVLAALGYAGVTRFLFPAAAALAVVGAAGVVWLMRHARVTPSVRAALVLVLVAQAAPSATRVGDLGGQGARVEARADLEQSLGRLLARVGRHALGAAPRLSSEGVVLTPLAWHAAVLPRSLRGWGIPGLRFAMRDKRWRPFWRAVHHRRRRFRARTIAHDGRLFVISIERQRLPSAAHRPLATRANDPDRAARRSRRDREPVAGRVPHALSDVVRGRGAAGRARSETAALEPRH